MQTWCDTHEPPRFSDETIATLSDEQIVNLVANLDYGAAHCGW